MAQRCTYCGRTKRQHFGKACVDKVGLAKAIAHMAPQISLECQHGSLVRSCEICERDQRISELEKIVDEFLDDMPMYDSDSLTCLSCGTVYQKGHDATNCLFIRARAVREGK